MKLPRHAEIWLPAYLSDRARSLLGTAEAQAALGVHHRPLRAAWRGVSPWRPRFSASLVGRRPGLASPMQPPATPPAVSPATASSIPQEEYRPELLEPLAEMTRQGIGDVEVHIHHDRETAEGFIRKIVGFCRRLRDDHGLLHDHNGRMVFGFIHGNWALDNSRPIGARLRPHRRDRATARPRLLRRLHHAIAPVANAGATLSIRSIGVPEPPASPRPLIAALRLRSAAAHRATC